MRELEEGAIHDVLRNERRRQVIHQLQENGGSDSVRELSERIAAAETGEEPPPRDSRQSVYVSLHQTHLPKLDALDVVEYDTDAKRIDLRERVRELERYMDVGEGSVPWDAYYAGAALAGLVVLGGHLTATGVTLAHLVVVAALLFVLGTAGYRLWSETGERFVPPR